MKITFKTSLLVALVALLGLGVLVALLLRH